MNIYFITQGPFPYGMAQTNRLISIAGGLVNAGNKVKIICIKPTENHQPSLNSSATGIYKNIDFVYPSGTTYRHKNALIRLYHYLLGIFLSGSLLISENKIDKIHFVFIGVTSNFNYLWFLMICKILKIKILQERSEYPFIKEKVSVLDGLSLFIYLKLICKRFDGFVVITRKLNEFFKPYLKKGCPVFLLPILVEPSRFHEPGKVSEDKYIAYCGSMQGDKDGIPILIDSFKIFHSEFPHIKLYLIGSTEFEEFKLLKEKIKELSLENVIYFTGKVSRDDLPAFLSNAIMLVLSRPNNKQSEAGFPTKLGEYLATGKPVVVTDIGEISVFLKDNENAFISNPGNAHDFAEKMKQVMLNYDEALRIGMNGKQLTETVFNSSSQGIKLSEWLKSLY